MGFRFRKSIRIMPGVRINLSKGGVSTSIGGRGATVNLSKRGARGTVGIPGSGLSYSAKLGGGGRQSGPSPDGPAQNGGKGCGCLLVILLIVVAALLFR